MDVDGTILLVANSKLLHLICGESEKRDNNNNYPIQTNSNNSSDMRFPTSGTIYVEEHTRLRQIEEMHASLLLVFAKGWNTEHKLRGVGGSGGEGVMIWRCMFIHAIGRIVICNNGRGRVSGVGDRDRARVLRGSGYRGGRSNDPWHRSNHGGGEVGMMGGRGLYLDSYIYRESTRKISAK